MVRVVVVVVVVEKRDRWANRMALGIDPGSP